MEDWDKFWQRIESGIVQGLDEDSYSRWDIANEVRWALEEYHAKLMDHISAMPKGQ